MQPLAFSKELLPVGTRTEQGLERPRAVSEYVVERLVAGGATRICFVIAPGKSDIVAYYGASTFSADVFYAVQPEPAGLCDAIFRAAPLVHDDDWVLVGLPDTIWYPEDALARLPPDPLSFLLFPVDQPQHFDAVVTDAENRVQEIQVKQPGARSNWVWGAFRMSGRTMHELRELWRLPERQDDMVGTLVNAYLARGGRATAVREGTAYVDTGTIDGYREALRLLASTSSPEST
ncbi:MAG: nucleotidyltransferase family protein [Acidobacteria bacterium]|nr:nucleotidyltransferase family protein [Acidobacteriota bacterium]